VQATLTLNGELSEILAYFNQAATTPATITAVVETETVEEPYVEGSLDIQGLPWDERIHAANKTKNADNSWRKRRGVDAGLVAQVEAELRGTPQPVVTAPVVAPVFTPQPVVTAPVATGVEPVTNEMTFADLMQNMGPKFQTQVLTQDYINKDVINYVFIRTGVQLGIFAEIQKSPHLIPIVVEKLQMDGKW
jgi:hypothetical protein